LDFLGESLVRRKGHILFYQEVTQAPRRGSPGNFRKLRGIRAKIAARIRLGSISLTPAEHYAVRFCQNVAPCP
jgi:hypothetical protein